jgi:N-methylhydantoinase B
MMEEFSLDQLDELAGHIIDTSREAVQSEIAKLPKGAWRASLALDGQGEPVELKAKLTISDGHIHVDYTGSAAMSKRNFNVPICYTLAYTSYALGCIIARDIPNNAGSLEPRTVSAPEGCILNAIKPAAVISRSQVGLMLPDLVFGCLRQAIPDRVPAESTCALWGITILGPKTSPPKVNERYQVQVVTTGGMGALPFRDGLSATGFPSGVRGGPIEVFEAMSTVIVWRKQYRQDSGGAGRMRGGLGQVIEMENGIDEAFLYNTTYERVDHPARGVDGGGFGAAGVIRLRSGRHLAGKGQHLVPAGDRVIILSPGGGGVGDPRQRSRAQVAADLANELISPDAARDLYGLELAAAE